MPGMESKPADVFAFGMFAVEVFTGKIPFDEHKNEAVVLRISQGGRPDMPENAQAVGLTGEIWKLLESCWQQNPKKRPTMDEIVRRWEKFVENGNDDVTFFPECVQTTLVIPTLSSVPFSTSYDRPREPQPQARSTSRPRAKTVPPRPPPMSDSTRLQTRSTAPKLRTEAHQPRPISNGPSRPRTTSEFARPGAKSEVTQRGIRPEVVQPRAQASAPLPGESLFSEGYRSKALMYSWST